MARVIPSNRQQVRTNLSKRGELVTFSRMQQFHSSGQCPSGTVVGQTMDDCPDADDSRNDDDGNDDDDDDYCRPVLGIIVCNLIGVSYYSDRFSADHASGG